MRDYIFEDGISLHEPCEYFSSRAMVEDEYTHSNGSTIRRMNSNTIRYADVMSGEILSTIAEVLGIAIARIQYVHVKHILVLEKNGRVGGRAQEAIGTLVHVRRASSEEVINFGICQVQWYLSFRVGSAVRHHN